MFEGKLPSLPQGHDSEPGIKQQDSLHEITWSDLRARLEAARDMRASMKLQGENGPASFDTDSARRIASQLDGKDAVNLRDLANSKQGWTNKKTSHGADTGSVPR